jgi:hypothetical protein
MTVNESNQWQCLPPHFQSLFLGLTFILKFFGLYQDKQGVYGQRTDIRILRPTVTCGRPPFPHSSLSFFEELLSNNSPSINEEREILSK